MTQAEFLTQLENALFSLTAEERESAMSYYREYLEEAGADEAAAIEALGSPQSVADRILREIGEGKVSYAGSQTTGYQYTEAMPEPDPVPNKGGRVALTILVAVVSFPIWFTVLCIWASLIVTIVAVVLGVGAGALGGIIQGLIMLFTGENEALWDIGSGVFLAGVTMLWWKPALLAIKYSSVGLWTLCKKCIRALMGN